MQVELLWRGFVLGFAIAAPVGPIGLLCIQRTLDGGRWLGLVSGLGAATADAFYGLVAGFGLTLISTFLVSQQRWLGLIGGAFLCYLGVRTLLSAPATKAAQQRSTGLLGAYGSTLLLTLTNPMTILAFAAMFAGAGLVEQGRDPWAAMLLVLGVFAGSAAWWLLLSGVVSLFRTRISATALQWINRAAGLVIIGFGVSMVIRLLSR
jgi:threonine/homoserine/homoserine lactone efflux protein